MQQNDKMHMIRIALLQRGLSISAWARSYNYNAQHASKVINRYTQNVPKRMPQSPFVFSVLTALKTDTGINLMEKEG